MIGVPGDKGVKGLKNSEFVDADQVGITKEDRAQLPDSVKFYLKGQAFQLANKKVVVNLYELRDLPGDTKMDRQHLEKMNFIPDEEYMALNYGPTAEGSAGYMWIGKWWDESGEKGIVSETIIISEKWRRRYEAHQAKLDGQAAGVKPAAGASASLPAAGSKPAGEWGPLEVLSLIQQGEERAYRNLKMCAEIFRMGNHNETPADVLAGAYKGANEMMMGAVKTNLEMAKAVGRATQEALEGVDEIEPVPAVEPGPSVPAWLEPFLPQLKSGLEKLLGGGPVGAAAKTLILSSDEWKTIFSDKDKFGQAIAAMEARFGSDKTGKALDILLNRRTKKK